MSSFETNADDGVSPNKRLCNEVLRQQVVGRDDRADRLESCVSSLIKCAVCLDTFAEPVSLSCLHTFCLKCIEKVHENSGKPVAIVCPTCRQQSIVPPVGVSGFPHNFIVDNLIGANKSVLEYCKQHANELAVEFCFNCNTLMCEACIENHPLRHDSRSIKDAVAHFHQQLDDSAGKLCDFGRFEDHAVKLEREKTLITTKLNDFKKRITNRGLKLRRAIDKHVDLLLKKVTRVEKKTLQDIERKLVQLAAPKSELLSIKSVARELKTSSKLSELQSAVSDLEARVQKLTNELSSVVLEDYVCPDVHFEPLASQQVLDVFNFRKNCIGSVSVKVQSKGVHPYLVDAPMITSISVSLPGPRGRMDLPEAVAQLDGKLIAGTAMSPYIAVFLDHSPYTRLPDIKIAGMYLSSLVACKNSNCVYVADDTAQCVWRATLDGAVDKLICLRDHMVESENQFQLLLSVKAGRFIATLQSQCKLVAFDTDGKEQYCIDTLRVKPNFFPRDAVETSRDTCVVSFANNASASYGFNDSYIGELDKAGTVIREYNLGNIEIRRLALDRAGNVFLLDMDGDQIMLLNDKLKLLGRLMTCGRSESMVVIQDLSYDDSSGRLLLLSADSLCLYQIKK